MQNSILSFVFLKVRTTCDPTGLSANTKGGRLSGPKAFHKGPEAFEFASSKLADSHNTKRETAATEMDRTHS